MGRKKKLTDITICENPHHLFFVFGLYGKGKKGQVITFGEGTNKEEAIADARKGKYKDEIEWYEAFYSTNIDKIEVFKSGHHKYSEGGGVKNLWYQAEYYDKQGGHGSVSTSSSNFKAEYREAMELYKREKKQGELGKSTGYVGVNGSGNEFAILYIDKPYYDSMAEKFFNSKEAYEAWMKVAKKVLDTGKPAKGKYTDKMKTGGGVRNFSRDRMFVSEEKWEQDYLPSRVSKPKKYKHHHEEGGGVGDAKPVSFVEDAKTKGLFTVTFSDGEKVIVDFTLPDFASQHNEADIFRQAKDNYQSADEHWESYDITAKFKDEATAEKFRTAVEDSNISYSVVERKGTEVYVHNVDTGADISTDYKNTVAEILKLNGTYEKSIEKMKKGGGIAIPVETTIEYLDNPMFREYSMFGDAQKFFQQIIDARYVYVDVSPNTKTSVHISLYFDHKRFAINSQHREGLKYHEKEETSMFDYRHYRAYYLKPKSITDIQAHVENALKEIMPTLELKGFVLKIYKTKPVLALIGEDRVAPADSFESGGNVEAEENEFFLLF